MPRRYKMNSFEQIARQNGIVTFKIDGVFYEVERKNLPLLADEFADMVIACKDQMQFVKNKLPIEIAKAVGRKRLGLLNK